MHPASLQATCQPAMEGTVHKILFVSPVACVQKQLLHCSLHLDWTSSH